MPAKSRKSARESREEPAAGRASPRKTAAKRRVPKAGGAKPATQADEGAVKAWIADVKPEHRGMVKRVDRILREEIPDVVPTVKYRKPSQPLGVPFYGRPGHGWIAAVWSWKDKVSVGFFGGVDLDPPPPRAIGARMRLVDIAEPSELDEKQLRAWTKQAAKGQGWARV